MTYVKFQEFLLENNSPGDIKHFAMLMDWPQFYTLCPRADWLFFIYEKSELHTLEDARYLLKVQAQSVDYILQTVTLADLTRIIKPRYTSSSLLHYHQSIIDRFYYELYETTVPLETIKQELMKIARTALPIDKFNFL